MGKWVALGDFTPSLTKMDILKLPEYVPVEVECPFCKTTIFIRVPLRDDRDCMEVECDVCGAELRIHYQFGDKVRKIMEKLEKEK